MASKKKRKPNLLPPDDDGEIRIEIPIRGRKEKKRRIFFVFFLYGRIRSYLTSTSSFFVHQLNDDGIDWSNNGGNCGYWATHIPLVARDAKSFSFGRADRGCEVGPSTCTLQDVREVFLRNPFTSG